MHVVGSSISAAAGAAGSHKPAWAQKPAPSGADTLAAGGSRTEPVDQVTLSAAAQEFSAHGNAANSPAHRARALIAERPDLAGMPFGKVVSGLIHNSLPAAAATSDATETAPTDGAPPAITDTEPPTAPATESTAPGAESAGAGTPPSTTGEEPPAVAAAGDAAPPADAAAVDQGGAGELTAPAPGAIDTAQLIEDLLDQNATSAEAA